MKKIIYILFLTVFINLHIFSGSVLASADWANGEILELQAKGVISENPEIDKTISRAEFTKMIINSMGLQKEAELLQSQDAPFIDITNHHPLRGYILAAWERGLISGYNDNTFKPEEELRRDQMIVLLLRLISLNMKEDYEPKLPFIDKEEIPTYALASISEAYKLGLVKGYDDGTFRPENKVSLAEGAAFLNRMLELSGERYDFSGFFQGYDEETSILRLKVAENELVMPVKADATVIIKGKKAMIKDLVVSESLVVKLDFSGNIILIVQKAMDEAEMFVSFVEKRFIPNYNAEEEESVNTSSLFSPRLPRDMMDIEKSFYNTKAEINLPSLEYAVGSDGKGKVIAVIDTGIDPSHPDFALTTDGKRKIIDWADFTSEGIITLESAILQNDKTLKFGDVNYLLGDIPSSDRMFKIGKININTILPLELIDFEDKEQSIAILTAFDYKDKVSTVYFDTNGDKSFVNEKAVKVFRDSGDFVLVEYEDKELALLVADIDQNGAYIQVGSDLSGHGTHVAGILAANGKMQGIAPGAQLMILRAVNRDGYANPINIQEAIRYAAIHGADIINISLGLYQDINPGQSSLAQVVNEVVEKYGVVVVTAAGNTGPGINTAAAPADADKAISVGAFVSPRMWETDFGYTVEEDSLYYFSSVGPRRDGAWYPTLIAPGSAISTVPRWMGSPYMLTEGTSMAAPYVSGTVAHLLEIADKAGREVKPALIKRVLEESARNLENFSVVEDGHGVLDAYAAYQRLQEIENARKIKATVYNPEFGKGTGVYAREYTPGRLQLKINNTSSHSYQLKWNTSAEWLETELKQTYLGSRESRELALEFNVPLEQGIYSCVLIGDDAAIPGVEVEMPINIIVGESISQNRPYVYTTLGNLKPAKLNRYFIKVPDGAEQLTAALEIFPDTSGGFVGRGRIHLINPYGLEEKISDYAGLAPYALTRTNKVETSVFAPEAGTWEVVVYSSASLSNYDIESTKYQLTVEMGDIVEITTPEVPPDYSLVFSPVVQKALINKSGKYTLHIWDTEENIFFNGVLEINGKLYDIRNGKLPIYVDEIKDKVLRVSVLKG